jgi:hypothetical protein
MNRHNRLDRTILRPKHQLEETVQSEQVQEVPRQSRDVSDVHIRSSDIPLKHCLETVREGERKLDYSAGPPLVIRGSSGK